MKKIRPTFRTYGMSVLACIITILAGTSRCMAGNNNDTAADILRVVIPATAYGMTFYQNDQEGRGQFSKALLTTVGITYGLKATIKHNGPNGHAESFPSGHAATAFSGASFLHKRYGWELGIPAYAAATFVGWSRIDSDDHDTTDVVAGAAISMLSTYFFTTEQKLDLEVVPTMDDNSLGVKIFGRW